MQSCVSLAPAPFRFVMRLVWRLLLHGSFAASAGVLQAQRIPSAEEAQRLLKSRSDLAAQVRQRVQTSGLTPEQLRARLTAAGYPSSLLDQFLATGTATDSAAPSNNVLTAMRRLGLVDSTEFATFSQLATEVTPPLPFTVEPDTTRVLPGKAAERDTLRIFGLDLFRGAATTQFDANLAGPVDPSYRLGPGDQLVLILTGDVEEAYTLDVTREGFVVVPAVGQLPVANLTLAQLNDQLYQRLGRVYSGVRRGSDATTRFSVSLARLRSIQVYVVGDVRRPGSYRVSSLGTALTALYAAGGPSDVGSLRRLELRRGSGPARTVDFYDYLLRGDASRDPRLENGDVLFVPVHGPRVRVEGRVIRPGIYEVTPDEGLASVLAAAGGFAAEAGRSRVQIERIANPATRAPGRERVVLDVTGDALASAGSPRVNVEPGDVVRVFGVSERVRNRVTITGNVWTPGPVGFTTGLTLGEALRRVGGAKPDTYLGTVLISRLGPDSSRSVIRAALRDTTGTPVQEVALAEDDEIRIFSLTEFRPDRHVVIGGAVRNPGRFPYREGMTLRDLVLLAGGLEQSALLTEAEVARMPENRAGGTLATTLRTPLDSTYVFDRVLNRPYPGPPGVAAPGSGSPEFGIKAFDNVLILRQPDWEIQRIVAIVGEVRYPGSYSLKSKSERLSDLIQRAGGLTSEGYADGMRFFRRRGAIGRVGLDLERVLRDPSTRDNVALQDGDSIFVPNYSPVVTVTGAVNAPVAVAYVQGKSLDYYISAAGGGSRLADLRRAFVTQPNGSVQSRAKWLMFSRDPQPRAGAAVTVPERDPNDRRDWLQIAGNLAQVLASLVAVVAVATR